MNATRVIAEELGLFVESKSSTFTCGGSIDISTESAKSELSRSPVAVRWDSPNGVGSVVFPVTDSEGEAKLAQLAQDCQPATFGFKGEDVLDETYRKATKMDRSAFCSDFCPYELGIVDTIAQVLLPNSHTDITTRGVRAELYKLNIYSAPSGFFKSHVDTPRSDAQFGSLVVSLPCHHEGGQLIVRHAGHNVTFDWGSSKAKTDAIHWAAFYSDCEHEVFEITEGHRVTLTYNLYYAPGVGDLADHSPAMDVQKLPLYQKVHEALQKPDFLPNGGNLGFFCTHAYAHTTEEGGKALPGVLKGADMAVYSVFKAHGLDIRIQAVLDDEEALEEQLDSYEGDDSSSGYIAFQRFANVGRLPITCAGGDDGYSVGDILDDYNRNLEDVTWLAGPQERLGDTGFVHLTYGNQAGIGAMYTYAAMLVAIPSAAKRLDFQRRKRRKGSGSTD